jgi:hypothetical protein
MITLTYTPWKPTFADASEPSVLKELTMTIDDCATWEEATNEWYNFLRGASYVIPYDFEMDEEKSEIVQHKTQCTINETL